MLMLMPRKRGKAAKNGIFICDKNSYSNKRSDEPSSSVSSNSCSSSSASSNGKYKGRKKNHKSKTVTEVVDETLVSEAYEERDDIVDRFWKFIECYCGEIKTENIKFLEQLMKESQESDDYLKLAELGVHYSKKWFKKKKGKIDKSAIFNGHCSDEIIDDGENKSHINHSFGDKKRGLSPYDTSNNERSPKKTKNSSLGAENCGYGFLTRKMVSCLIEESNNSIDSFDSTTSIATSVVAVAAVATTSRLTGNPHRTNVKLSPKTNGNGEMNFSHIIGLENGESFNEEKLRRELDDYCLVNFDDDQYHDALDHFVEEKDEDKLTVNDVECEDEHDEWFSNLAKSLNRDSHNSVNGNHRVNSDSETESEENIEDTSRDEIRDEIVKCQNELQRISQSNQSFLRNLIDRVGKEVRRQQLSKELHDFDDEMLETFRKILNSKQKKKYFSDREHIEALRLLEERSTICKKLDKLDIDEG